MLDLQKGSFEYLSYLFAKVFGLDTGAIRVTQLSRMVTWHIVVYGGRSPAVCNKKKKSDVFVALVQISLELLAQKPYFFDNRVLAEKKGLEEECIDDIEHTFELSFPAVVEPLAVLFLFLLFRWGVLTKALGCRHGTAVLLGKVVNL